MNLFCKINKRVLTILTISFAQMIIFLVQSLHLIYKSCKINENPRKCAKKKEKKKKKTIFFTRKSSLFFPIFNNPSILPFASFVPLESQAPACNNKRETPGPRLTNCKRLSR